MRWVRVWGHPVWDPVKNQLVGIYGAVQDITERKKVEAEREALIRELEAKNAELERFAYTVSHDLKSPLITIRGFLSFVEQDAESGNLERVRADLGRIRDAVDKMQRLLSELLELSRIGRVVNPLLASGQMEGGVAQGVGFALYEDAIFKDGRMVNGQLTNYILPTSADAPRIRAIFEEVPYAHGPGRAKGIEARVGLRLGEEEYLCRLGGGAIRIEAAPLDEADAVLAGPVAAVAGAIYGGRKLEELEEEGLLRVEGDRALAGWFVTLFPLPPKAAREG